MNPENNPFADFTAVDMDTGDYFIDYNLANEEINKIEDENERNTKIEMLNRHANIFEQFSNAYKNNIMALEELVDEVNELYNHGQDEYYALVDRIAESLVTITEREIEELENISDTIEDSQSQIIEGI
jgi:Fe2+ transport system protein B